MKYFFIIFFIMSTRFSVNGQAKTDFFLQDLLLQQKAPLLQEVLTHPEEYRYQIIYTQINRDPYNHPSFKNYYYHVDSMSFFDPASTVKMPLAFLALEKLNRIHKPGVDKYTALRIDSNYSGQTPAYEDRTAENGLPSIAQYIKKAFLVSDNDAYNRLYEFVGQQTINQELHQKGYKDVRITRQFLPMTENENRHTNAISFINKEGDIIYRQPPAFNEEPFDFSHVVKLGKAHWDSNDSLIHAPMDFTRHNNISLEDLQQIEQSVLFPESVPGNKRFELTSEDFQFLYQYMSQYPSETNYPKYDSSKFYDSYVKFFFRGEKMPSYLRVFNKVGWSYGFLTDVSYVADFKHQIEYMLSCVLYVNSNGILNDNHYDYDSIGYPFLRALGNAIHQFELSRPRKYAPDLSRFIIKYENRDPKDKRPTLKEVDN